MLATTFYFRNRCLDIRWKKNAWECRQLILTLITPLTHNIIKHMLQTKPRPTYHLLRTRTFKHSSLRWLISERLYSIWAEKNQTISESAVVVIFRKLNLPYAKSARSPISLYRVTQGVTKSSKQCLLEYKIRIIIGTCTFCHPLIIFIS